MKLQQQNENSIKYLSKKVSELSTSISKFKKDVTDRTDNTMAFVHEII